MSGLRQRDKIERRLTDSPCARDGSVASGITKQTRIGRESSNFGGDRCRDIEQIIRDFGRKLSRELADVGAADSASSQLRVGCVSIYYKIIRGRIFAK